MHGEISQIHQSFLRYVRPIVLLLEIFLLLHHRQTLRLEELFFARIVLGCPRLCLVVR